MIRLALFGSGVSLSLSKAIYEGLADRRGLRLSYELVEVDRASFRGVLESMLSRGLHGFNATKPVKEDAFREAGAVDEHSRVIRAANAFVVVDGVVEAFNTDWIGFLMSLRTMDSASYDSVLVLGAGGAGRAAVYALLREGLAGRVYVASRSGVTAERAAELLRSLGSVEAVPLAEARLLAARVDLLVNATPIGWGDGQQPLDTVPEPPCTVVDMVYRPLATSLLRMAASKGCVAVDGLWMLVFQAAENLRLWLGLEADPLELRSIALASLGGGRRAAGAVQE